MKVAYAAPAATGLTNVRVSFTHRTTAEATVVTGFSSMAVYCFSTFVRHDVWEGGSVLLKEKYRRSALHLKFIKKRNQEKC